MGTEQSNTDAVKKYRAMTVAVALDRKAKGLPPLTFPGVARRRAQSAGQTAPDRATPRKALPCSKLGEPTGQSRPCQGCGGRVVAVPLMACEVYGVCSTNKVVKLEDGTPVACCAAMCPGYVARAT